MYTTLQTITGTKTNYQMKSVGESNGLRSEALPEKHTEGLLKQTDFIVDENNRVNKYLDSC